jgi:hypothetical protein
MMVYRGAEKYGARFIHDMRTGTVEVIPMGQGCSHATVSVQALEDFVDYVRAHRCPPHSYDITGCCVWCQPRTA